MMTTVNTSCQTYLKKRTEQATEKSMPRTSSWLQFHSDSQAIVFSDTWPEVHAENPRVEDRRSLIGIRAVQELISRDDIFWCPFGADFLRGERVLRAPPPAWVAVCLLARRAAHKRDFLAMSKKGAEDARRGSREAKAAAPRPASVRVSSAAETPAPTQSPARGGVAGSSGDRFLPRETVSSARRRESTLAGSSARRSPAREERRGAAQTTQPPPSPPPKKDDKEAVSPAMVQPQASSFFAALEPGAPVPPPPPGLERQEGDDGFGPPPGLAGPILGLPDLFASTRKDFMEASIGTGFETDTTSLDEEVELLRCEKDLVEAAAELGTTTSAEDDLLTDPDMDEEEDGRSLSKACRA
ncbi:unnamed protein product [Effrenium voratum]|nr:unnamed protein product [Effrenium voratum]